MATFSPSPAPRRSTRNRPVANSPPRRIRVTGNSRTTSRLATPVRQPERNFAHDHGSVVSVMDVDEGASVFSERTTSRLGGDGLFAKSEQLSVSFYATLPVELTQILKNANFFRDAYSGDIDTLTGFALVASAQTCFIWQHAQALKGTPTCYIFSCPQDYQQSSPPFHALIPYSSSREPGLILISLDGVIRFWDSIGIGLAGGDRYTTMKLDVSSNEQVTNLIRSDVQTHVVSTTAGNLFRLTLTSSGGKYHLTSHLFARPTQSLSLSRLLPSIFSSSGSTPAVKIGLSRNISAVAIGATTPNGGKEIWAIVDTRLQKWDMKPEGWEEILLDGDVSSVLASAIRKTFGSRIDSDDKQVDLELLDLAIDDDKLVVLISYAVEDSSSMALDTSGVRRIYAVAHMSVWNDTFEVLTVRSVPYQSTYNAGAPMHPRIQLVLDGALISVQFGDAVALCARDVNYRDRLELKATTDRTLGVGATQDDGLLILTAATMMKVSINLDKVLAYDFENGEAKLVKSTLTQAILYSGIPDNPLHFSFPPDLNEESLMQGAEQLSQAVLESDPELVHANHDLGAQLTERKERLSWLIRFINDNVVLVKMSQQSRQKLATDAEKLFACYQLWLRHNELLATNPTQSILNDAVHAYMAEVGEGHHEDILRAFFRMRVGEVGNIIKNVAEITTQAAHLTGKNIVEFLPEANRIVLTVLNSAFDYREYNLGVYGIDTPMIRPWTSRPSIIDVILSLFDATTKAIDSPSPGYELKNTIIEPNSQLPQLAATLFACIQERLDWLGSAVAAAESGNEREKDELTKKFDMLRPEVLETLRRTGHAGAAFTLAEKYRDFSGLAALCHKETVYPPEENPNSLRIQAYVERFKEEFTTELYRWYIQHGELRVMFAQDDSHDAYMDKFFAENPIPAISWIHDLGKGRYASAANALLVEAEQASKLEAKHLMLSIGKLSHLAQLHETNATLDDSVLDAFHDDLDFVSVHEALLEDFKSAFQGVRGRQSLDSQIDLIVKAKAATLSDKKALTEIFKDFVRGLLQGRALSIEDAVDVLTLKDNSSTLEDFATALHLLARVQNLPEARRASAFRTVWRRIYIHDDWDTIRKTANISDAELSTRFRNTALYATLLTIQQRDQLPEGYEISPDEALITPTETEISSRWPGLSPEQVEALVQDYNLECDRLGDLDLNDVYQRVRELAVSDALWNVGS